MFWVQRTDRCRKLIKQAVLNLIRGELRKKQNPTLEGIDEKYGRFH